MCCHPTESKAYLVLQVLWVSRAPCVHTVTPYVCGILFECVCKATFSAPASSCSVCSRCQADCVAAAVCSDSSAPSFCAPQHVTTLALVLSLGLAHPGMESVASVIPPIISIGKPSQADDATLQQVSAHLLHRRTSVALSSQCFCHGVQRLHSFLVLPSMTCSRS